MSERQAARFSVATYLPDHPQKLAITLRECLETDLSAISTFIDLAEHWHQEGNLTDAARASQQAGKCIELVYRCLTTTRLLAPMVKNSVRRRCTGLQLRLMGIDTKLLIGSIERRTSQSHNGAASRELVAPPDFLGRGRK
jgi:hypothetical protein